MGKDITMHPGVDPKMIEAAAAKEKEQIRKIHTLAGRLGMDKSCYYSMLWDSYKVNSSKELTHGQRASLINRLVSQIRQSRAEGSGASEKQVKLILYLGIRHCTNLKGFLTKVVRREVKGPQELTMAEGIKVIDALKRYER